MQAGLTVHCDLGCKSAGQSSQQHPCVLGVCPMMMLLMESMCLLHPGLGTQRVYESKEYVVDSAALTDSQEDGWISC